jgi:hypothetical protein
MSRVTSIPVPALQSVVLELTPPNLVRLSGTITSKEPDPELTAFLRALQRAVLEDAVSELRVDVSGLTFVNSAAIRVFVDMATWVQREARSAYKLRFLTNRRVTWQKTSFMALSSLARGVVVVDHVE